MPQKGGTRSSGAGQLSPGLPRTEVTRQDRLRRRLTSRCSWGRLELQVSSIPKRRLWMLWFVCAAPSAMPTRGRRSPVWSRFSWYSWFRHCRCRGDGGREATALPSTASRALRSRRHADGWNSTRVIWVCHSTPSATTWTAARPAGTSSLPPDGEFAVKVSLLGRAAVNLFQNWNYAPWDNPM